MTIISQTKQVGTNFSYQIFAIGNATLFRAENLPSGWSCNSTGLITGVVPNLGRFVITLLAGNASGFVVAVLDISTNTPPVPIITSSDSTTAEISVPFSYQITATSVLPILSYNATNLPAWASIDTVTGLITGTPNSVSFQTVYLTATNANGDGTQDLILNTNARPVISSALTFSCSKDASTSYQVTASASPISYTASGLPTGLTLNTSTGLISGTPTASGSFNVILTATNIAYTSNPATLVLQVTQLPVITSSLTATATYNVAFSYQITTSGYPSPTSYTATNLPSGLSVNTSTGLISGTLNMSYSAPFIVLISATNAIGTTSAELIMSIVNKRANITQDTIMKPYFGTSPDPAPWVIMGRDRMFTSINGGSSWTATSLSSTYTPLLLNNANQENLDSRVSNLARNPIDSSRKNLMGSFVLTTNSIPKTVASQLRTYEYWGQFATLVDRFRLYPDGLFFNLSSLPLPPENYYLLPMPYKRTNFPAEQTVYSADGGLLLGGLIVPYLTDGYLGSNGYSGYIGGGLPPFFGSLRNSVYLRNKKTAGVATNTPVQNIVDAGGGAVPNSASFFTNCIVASTYVDISLNFLSFARRGLQVASLSNPNLFAKSTYISNFTQVGSLVRLFLSKNPLGTSSSATLQFYYPSTSRLLPSKPASGGPNGVPGAYSILTISLVTTSASVFLNPVGTNIDGGRGYDQIAQNEDGDIIVVAGGAYGATKTSGENTMAYSTDFGGTWTVIEAAPSSSENSFNLYYFKPTQKFYVTYGSSVYSSSDAVTWALDSHPGTDATNFAPRQFAKDLDKEPFYDVPNDSTFPRNTKNFAQVRYLGVENFYPLQVAIADENRTNWVISTLS